MKSKYLERFKAVTKAELRMATGRLLVELLPKEDKKTSGGLYVPGSPRDDMTAPTLAIVLAHGQDYVKDDGTTEGIDTPIGAVIMIPADAVRAYSTFPGLQDYAGGDIAMVRESDIVAEWATPEDFDAYSLILNRKLT